MENSVFVPDHFGIPGRCPVIGRLQGEYSVTLLEMDSNFGLIFDTDSSISIVSAITINNYIGKRCNTALSIKLACDATSWPTYISLNGPIDAIHDYGTVELDDCIKQYTKKMKEIKESE